MPFGSPGHREFGAYFVAYSRSPGTIEQMLENMFIGRPPGNYDRILDFSTAVTGNLFFTRVRISSGCRAAWSLICAPASCGKWSALTS